MLWNTPGPLVSLLSSKCSGQAAACSLSSGSSLGVGICSLLLLVMSVELDGKVVW